ncbi:hypothetical protein DFH07DRAFT_960614 [Mycena maculata]|uniref:Uncharacterized protein n=1 Tax=Mycena maculata TaxID=230809 RepID=A0AAD7IWY1_9AGAR|nr:hypothetical protein DFH07DRAFT_960614 [Mycena maculata]
MNPSEKRQFGMPFKGVIPQEPPLELFVWDADSISTAGKPDVEKLVPAPAVPKPEFGSYPQAPEYTLNAELDRSYRRGWRYAAPFWTFNREQERERMLEIRMPPNVAPTRLNMHTRSFVCDPIPGMVQLPLGIPLVHQVNGDPKRAVTVVCAHTLTTLAQYKEGPQIAALVPRLMELTWGREPSGDNPGLPAIFEHIGMKTNLRSKVVNLSKFKNDGSYNLASTHGEGEGHGHFAPAVQTNTPEAAVAIKEVLQILHRLYRLVMPLCISRFEWDMMEFNGYENNVVAFGGIEPGPTSCQGNASSAANVFDLDLPADGAPSPIHVLPSDGDPLPIQVDLDLPADGDNSPTQVDDSEQVNESEEVDLKKLLRAILESAGLDTALGPQGSPHADLKDDPLWFTLFVLAFCLPPGSDLGAFLWMRGGIYLRETNEYLFLCSFKAQDIHSGSAPTYIKRLLDAMISLDQAKMLFERFGTQVRFGYVLYPSLSATTHNVPILYSPSSSQPELKKPDKYARVPANLWGLLPAAKQGASIPLQPLNAKVILKDDTDIYKIAAKMLCSLWDEHLILKQMFHVDAYLNPNERKVKSRSELFAVRDRCIARGAILQCLADVLGDGLFASTSMKTFLIRPSRLFKDNKTRDSHMARAIERDEAATLQALDTYLATAVVEDPELLTICAELAELTHKGLLSLKLGHSLSDKEFEDPHGSAAASEHSFTKLAATSKGATNRRCLKPLVNSQPTLATLLPKKPSFGIAAIIIREALADRRKKAPTVETTIFRRLLTGHHPTTGDRTLRDRDQMDPICADSSWELDRAARRQSTLPASTQSLTSFFSLT